jgi:Flp pilus assembly protein TadB
VSAVPPALALLAAALVVWPSVRAPVRARVRRLTGPGVRRGVRVRPDRPDRPAARAPGDRSGRVRALGLPAAAGGAAALLVGGPGGWLLGLVVAGAVGALLRRARGPRPEEALTAAVTAELPVACDLLAVCLGAGVPVGTALAAVGASVAEPLRTELLRVAALYRLGAEPGHAWAGTPASLAPLGRAVTRAGWSGSSVRAALNALAADVRATQRARGEAAVRRAGVWVLAPLGACFLPAFVCLGVVPLVLGLAAGVLG